MAPSPYWGAEPIWDSQTSNHNPMMDDKGRVWLTSRTRLDANPDFAGWIRAIAAQKTAAERIARAKVSKGYSVHNMLTVAKP